MNLSHSVPEGPDVTSAGNHDETFGISDTQCGFKDIEDRDAISTAIHRRAPFDCGPFVRARKMVVAYPSLKDRVRFHARTLWAKSEFQEAAENRPAEGSFSERTSLDPLINDIGFPFEGLSGKDGAADEGQKKAPSDISTWKKAKQFDKARQIVTEALRMARSCDTETAYKQEAIRRRDDFIDDLLKFKPQQILDDPQQDSREVSIDTSDKDIVLRWENYSHNHALQIIEHAKVKEDNFDQVACNFLNLQFDAFTSLSEQTRSITESVCPGCKKVTLKCPKRETESCMRGGNLRTHHADQISNIKPNGQPSSGILAIADYWVIPADAFFSDDHNLNWGKTESFAKIYAETPCPSGKDKEVQTVNDIIKTVRKSFRPVPSSEWPSVEERRIFGAISSWAAKFFLIGVDDEAPDNEIYPDDFVISFISNGRALLISDLRPDRNKTRVHADADRQSRTVIVDLGMHRSERGRMLQRLMDIATFRQLGLRDQPYAKGATDAITNLGIALSELSSRPEKSWFRCVTGREGWAEFSGTVKSLFSGENRKLNIIRRLSSALDLLNLFFTYGVNGRVASSGSYSVEIRRSLELLRESRVIGHQTLTGYLKRYHDAADGIAVMGARYNTLRTRINEAANLIKTGVEQSQFRAIALLAILAIALPFAQLVGGLIDVIWQSEETEVSTMEAATNEDEGAAVAHSPDTVETDPGTPENTDTEEPTAETRVEIRGIAQP